MSKINLTSWWRLAAAFTAGASTALAFAPYQIWPIYLLAVAVTLHLSHGLSPKQAFLHWLSFGFGCFAVGISWVHVVMDRFGGMPIVVSVLLMALLAMYLAIYPALAGYLFARLAPRKCAPSSYQVLFLFPSIWVVTEWLRGWVLTGFPWLWAGYSFTNSPLQPLASLVGALGLSFIGITLAGAVSLIFQKRLLPALGVSIALIGAVYIHPFIGQIQTTGKTISAALVQGNVAQNMKWEPEALWPTMLKYMDLSREHLDADLLLWPEAAIPAPEHFVGEFLDNASQVANLNDNAIITGIIRQENDEFYNALVVLGNYNHKRQAQADYRAPFDRTDIENRDNLYDKNHLLVVGEFVPFEDLLRPLAPFFNLPMSSFNRGNYQQPNLRAAGLKVAPAICYEIAFPEQLRANVHHDTDLLVTVSNDAWFGASNGPLQHMEIAQMRAVELGRPLLRATNTGVTAVVDHQGKILSSLPQFEAGVLRQEVELVSGKTWFTKFGQWPVLLLSMLLMMIAIIAQLISTKSTIRAQ
ncbi:apolipoprotein N-acyltransferase [Shewanella gelidii]|uniref:Apolipoprotein N-acyltransferase n=1 Tax=Shewanella gelidii TaxID=1642821 RepID=A0A917N6Y2_9GAMM|nr:apolipoprotein N-acyltransferase [Shewanella gelidii]MCL1097064.1 apolipoprotein N-acyltransferase [Shewanella gelidii]GGI72303.1 apolipoprotein N-acyltransferase [Shewanella gelidii]